MILKDYDTVQTISHSSLLIRLTTYDNINLGLVDICAYLHQPNHLLFEVSRCKQTIARPAIIDVIFLMIETVCTGFAGEENREDQESLCSIVFIAFDGLLLFTSD
ncbi:unnamed protein product [Rotaria sordida]|uniref:Uncharacterized protein n=1 Tax=Rotaria sordida TaxID=392033 RepID=A0A814UIA2_9BILA|nr:unnamed protein product [Rotaria sordida]